MMLLAVGTMMQQVYEALFLVEVGVGDYVLNQCFKKYGCLATKGTWFHNLWELFHYLKISTILAEKHCLKPAQIGNCPIMECFIQTDL